MLMASLTVFNLFVLGLNGLVLVGVLSKITELRIRRQILKENAHLSTSRNWRQR